MPFGIICQPRHRILHTQNLEMLSPEIQTADRFGKVQEKNSFGSSAWKALGDECGIVGFRISLFQLPSLKLTFSHLRMDGWNTILSYWVSAYAYVLLLLVSGRVQLWKGLMDFCFKWKLCMCTTCFLVSRRSYLIF